MEYEGQICRSPMERASFMLPVSVGCSYNRCHFCMLFKHLRYRELPLEQIEGELIRVRDAGGDPERVFLGDGNAFQLSAGRLLHILELVHRYFPACTTVNMDATVPSVLDKSDVKEVIKGLKSAAGYLRRELGRALQLRYTPELTFVADDSIAEGVHILEIIEKLEEKGE